MNNYYVYAHILDNETVPFYIGKGKGKRAYDTKNRSKFWNRVAKKGYRVEFIRENLSEEEALLLEVTMIKTLGRRDNKTGCLVNMTDGGDGLINPSEEVRKKIGIANTERFKDVKFREKFGLAQRNKIISEQTKRKMSEFHRAKKDNVKLLQMCTEYHRQRRERILSLKQPYILISPNGEEYECYLQTEFAKEHGLKLKRLNDLLLGRKKSLYGWQVKRGDDGTKEEN